MTRGEEGTLTELRTAPEYEAALFESERPADLTKGRLWTIQDVAAYFRIPAATVRKWLQTDQSFPRGVRVGKYRRWKSEEILAWENQLRQEQAK